MTPTREAVIDAATAVEVSLTAGLRGLDELVTDATVARVLSAEATRSAD
jgi:hypothetical protein